MRRKEEKEESLREKGGFFRKRERKKEKTGETTLLFSPGPRLRCPGCVCDVVDDDGSGGGRRGRGSRSCSGSGRRGAEASRLLRAPLLVAVCCRRGRLPELDCHFLFYCLSRATRVCFGLEEEPVLCELVWFSRLGSSSRGVSEHRILCLRCEMKKSSHFSVAISGARRALYATPNAWMQTPYHKYHAATRNFVKERKKKRAPRVDWGKAKKVDHGRLTTTNVFFWGRRKELKKTRSKAFKRTASCSLCSVQMCTRDRGLRSGCKERSWKALESRGSLRALLLSFFFFDFHEGRELE